MDKIFTLESIIENGSITFNSLIVCSIFSIILGIIVAVVYSFRTAYTKSFYFTLVLLPLLVQAIIMLANGSLGIALAVGGVSNDGEFFSLCNLGVPRGEPYIHRGAG